MQFFALLLELLAVEYVIRGVVVLANALRDQGMVDFGRKMRNLITVGYIAILVAEIIGNFNIDVYYIISMVSSIIQLVVYILYIIFLSRAKKLLAQ